MDNAEGKDHAVSGADLLGFEMGMLVQEVGWDEDVDADLRDDIMDTIDAEMVEEPLEAVDAVVLWWREEDGDVADGLVDASTDLAPTGQIWLLTPKVGRPGFIEPASISEGVTVAGLSLANTVNVAADWCGHPCRSDRRGTADDRPNRSHDVRRRRPGHERGGARHRPRRHPRGWRCTPSARAGQCCLRRGLHHAITSWSDVSGILNKGGTVIGTARSAEFRTPEGRKRAVANLIERGIDRLIVIGGDGSPSGSRALSLEWAQFVGETCATRASSPPSRRRPTRG